MMLDRQCCRRWAGQDSILDEVVDTPGSYADYYNVGAGVPFGLVSEQLVMQVTHKCCMSDSKI